VTGDVAAGRVRLVCGAIVVRRTAALAVVAEALAPFGSRVARTVAVRGGLATDGAVVTRVLAHPHRVARALWTLGALRTGGVGAAVGTLGPVRAVRAVGALGAVRADRAVRSHGAVGAHGTVRTVGTHGTVGTLGTHGTVGTLDAVGSAGAHRAVRASGAVGATRTVGPARRRPLAGGRLLGGAPASLLGRAGGGSTGFGHGEVQLFRSMTTVTRARHASSRLARATVQDVPQAPAGGARWTGIRAGARSVRDRLRLVTTHIGGEVGRSLAPRKPGSNPDSISSRRKPRPRRRWRPDLSPT